MKLDTTRKKEMKKKTEKRNRKAVSAARTAVDELLSKDDLDTLTICQPVSHYFSKKSDKEKHLRSMEFVWTLLDTFYLGPGLKRTDSKSKELN